MVIWFQWGQFTGFWLSIGGGCSPTGCSGICSVVGVARRYRLLVVATVLVLQALEGLSDREAIGRLRCDIRWKAAAGLALTDEGFHPTVLTLWRARLRRNNFDDDDDGPDGEQPPTPTPSPTRTPDVANGLTTRGPPP